MNKLIQKGNVTRDLELRYTPSGMAVVDFGIAVNRSWVDAQGQKKEDVTFTDWRAWGKSAESLSKFFHKGKPILLEGRLSQEEWEDKATGQKRRKTLAIVEHWEFAGDSRGGEAPPPGGQRTARPAPREVGEQGPPAGPMQEGLEDDDIPF